MHRPFWFAFTGGFHKLFYSISSSWRLVIDVYSGIQTRASCGRFRWIHYTTTSQIRFNNTNAFVRAIFMSSIWYWYWKWFVGVENKFPFCIYDYRMSQTHPFATNWCSSITYLKKTNNTDRFKSFEPTFFFECAYWLHGASIEWALVVFKSWIVYHH